MINIANDGYKHDPSIEWSSSNPTKTVALVNDQKITLGIPWNLLGTCKIRLDVPLDSHLIDESFEEPNLHIDDSSNPLQTR